MAPLTEDDEEDEVLLGEYTGDTKLEEEWLGDEDVEKPEGDIEDVEDDGEIWLGCISNTPDGRATGSDDEVIKLSGEILAGYLASVDPGSAAIDVAHGSVVIGATVGETGGNAGVAMIGVGVWMFEARCADFWSV